MNDLQLTVTTTKQKTNGSTFDKVNVNMLLKLYRSLDNALITAFIRLIRYVIYRIYSINIWKPEVRKRKSKSVGEQMGIYAINRIDTVLGLLLLVELWNPVNSFY